MACADVTSANVVGYLSQTIGDTSEIYTANVGGPLTAVDGKDMVVTDKICGLDLQIDDEILLLNCNYNQYDHYNVTADGLYLTSFTWSGTESKLIDSFTIPNGVGFIFTTYREGDTTISRAGQVAPSGTQTQTFQYKYDEESDETEFMFLLQNPFPIDTTLADIAAWADVEGDQVKVFNGEYYQEDFYNLTYAGWQKTSFTWDGTESDVIDPKDYATTIVIPAGHFGNFQPGNLDKEYVWSVTFNY